MKCRTAIWGLALGLILGFLSPQLLAAQGLTKINFNEVVHAISYAPHYVAFENKFFEKEGLDLKMQTGWGAHKTIPALLSGEADVSFIGPESSIYMVKQGAQPGKQVIIFAGFVQRDNLFLVARKPMPDFKWSDTKGKVILGWRKGSTPLMALKYALYLNKVDPDKDTQVVTNIEMTAQPGAFKSGMGDFNLSVEPTPSIFEKEGVGHTVASIGVATGILPYTVYAATSDYIEKNPQIIQKVTNAVYRGLLWTQSHSAEEIAKVITPQFPKVDLDIITMSVRRYKNQDHWPKIPVMTKEDFDRFQDIMIYNKEIDSKVDYDKIVTNKFANKAVELIKEP